VLVTLTFALGHDRWWLVGLIGVPLALTAGTCYFRLVEAPAHRFAKRAGRYARGLAQGPQTAA
jgi:peptidoglycan/LPS O-acetylase OafA/YrhL